MSGHSKWHNIQQKKGTVDAKRGIVFTKLAKIITIATREKGNDPETNFSLRLAIDRARSANMPKDNIQRAIDRGCGQGEGGIIESILYEGFGPGGVALLIETTTDNRNRTVNEIKYALSKNGGTFGASGSVAWQFEQKGIVRVESVISEDQQLLLIDAGAEDIHTTDDVTEIITSPMFLQQVRQAVQNAGFVVSDAGIEWIPKQTVPITSEDKEKLAIIIEALEELDEVSTVYDNSSFSSN